MDIEPVSRCNFRCSMCQVSGWENYRRAEDLSLGDFKELVEQQKGIIELKIQGMGEPLLNKDFFEMIKFAKKKSIWVRSVTNGSLLHVNDNYKKLVDSGIDEIQISIDGVAKETFEKIRTGSNFEQIKKNCNLINAYCESKDLLLTRMWTVLQKDNISEIYEFPKLAKELNFRRLTFVIQMGHWGQKEWLEKNKKVSAEKLVTPEMTKKLLELGGQLGIEVTFWIFASKYSQKTLGMLCPWPFERAYISSDSRIVPCCMIANPQVVDFGDAKKFIDSWNGDIYQNFRKLHIEGKIPPYCQNCYM